MTEPVVPFDIMRMLLGDAPPLFLLEIVVRTVVVYGWTLAMLRLVGGRGVAQLSLVEFLLVISLGSAVGDAPFYPDVPLLHALLVVTLIVLMNKGLDWLIIRFRPVKTLVDGHPVEVVQDGRILVGPARTRGIAAIELMGRLRAQGVRNLGEVETAWLEAGGSLSVFRCDEPRPGLPIVPPPELGTPMPDGEPACCSNCGAPREGAATGCEHCGIGDWTAMRREPARDSGGEGEGAGGAGAAGSR